MTPAALRALGCAEPDAWAPVLAAACAPHWITTPRRRAMFLARIMVETGKLRALAESLDYAPAALVKQWPTHFTWAQALRLGRLPGKPADQQGIAEAAYGGRLGNRPAGSGDGWLFRGSGALQLTGRANYQAFAARIGWKHPLEELPDLLRTKVGAAESAAAYWQASGCNEAADAGDVERVVLLVQGGKGGLAETRENYVRALPLLGDPVRAAAVPTGPGSYQREESADALNGRLGGLQR